MHRFYVLLMCLLFLTLFLIPLEAAQAVAVTNLSNSPKIIELKVSQGFEPHTIAPGETWRVTGKQVLRFNGSEFHLEDSEEYAVWNNDDFGPQFRRKFGKGAID